MTTSQSIIIGGSVASKNTNELSLLLATIISDPDVIGAAVYDTTGAAIDSFGKLKPESSELSKRITVNFFDGQGVRQVGELLIVMSDNRLRAEAIQNLIDHLVLGVVLLVTSIVATTIVHRKIVVQPLRRLAQDIEATRSGSPHVFDWQTNDEIGDLVTSYNTMQNRLASHEKALQEGRERFEGFAASASDWHWEMDKNARFTYISRVFSTITGDIPELFYGKAWNEFLDENDDQVKWKELLLALKNRKAFRNFDYPYKGKNARLYWVRLNGIPIYDKNGSFSGYRGSGSDISKMKIAEKTQRDTDQRFRALIEQIPAAIMIKDVSGKFLNANSMWHQWFNPDGKSISGRSIFDFTTDKHAETIDAIDKKIVETLKPIEVEIPTPALNGKEITTILQKFPIVDEQGNVVAIGSVNTDISERKMMEKELRLALIKAEEANHTKSEFLATMSHELRTPLNAIIGFSDVMLGEYFGELGNVKYLNYANDIKLSGQHLLSLISDILDVSAIELGRRELEIKPIYLGGVIANCVKLISAGAIVNAKRIDLITEIPDSLPLVEADERALQQILLNLLNNSIKFSDTGDVVRVSANSEGENIIIKVIDTGVGISKKDIPNLTKPFVRGHRNSFTTKEGVGLGLSIAKSLVEAHKGTLLIESRLNKGTAVTIVLPIKGQ